MGAGPTLEKMLIVIHDVVRHCLCHLGLPKTTFGRSVDLGDDADDADADDADADGADDDGADDDDDADDDGAPALHSATTLQRCARVGASVAREIQPFGVLCRHNEWESWSLASCIGATLRHSRAHEVP